VGSIRIPPDRLSGPVCSLFFSFSFLFFFIFSSFFVLLALEMVTTIFFFLLLYVLFRFISSLFFVEISSDFSSLF